MENFPPKWTKSGPFFPNSEHYLWFWKKGRGDLLHLPLFARLKPFTTKNQRNVISTIIIFHFQQKRAATKTIDLTYGNSNLFIYQVIYLFIYLFGLYLQLTESRKKSAYNKIWIKKKASLSQLLTLSINQWKINLL